MSDLPERRASVAVAGCPLDYMSHVIASSDGTRLSVQEHGVVGGRDVLFIHGFSQAGLAWLKQVASPLAHSHRLVTWDLRGHGASDKPSDAEAYRDTSLWAADVDAIIRRLGLVRPILVAWSYGGRVALDFLSHAGPDTISGLVMVAAMSSGDPSLLGSSHAGLLMMAVARDFVENVKACEQLLAVCTAHALPPEERALALGWNLAVPPSVRLALAGREADYDGILGRLDCPALAIHGSDDLINRVAMSDYFVSRVRGARRLLYEGCGHMPFWEEAGRFNKDLGEFLDSIR